MAGNSDDISNVSKPAKGPTEKKKRKRPSKKVPTTVLQANNTGFMHLVQKLTGSAEELAAGEASNNNQSSYSEAMTTYQSTATNDVETSHGYSLGYSYSSAPAYSTAPPYTPSFQDPYQQYQHHEPAPSSFGYGGYGSGGYGGSGSRSFGEGDVDDSSAYGYRDGVDHDNSSSPSRSRGLDQNDVSPGDYANHNSSSNYYWPGDRSGW